MTRIHHRLALAALLIALGTAVHARPSRAGPVATALEHELDLTRKAIEIEGRLRRLQHTESASARELSILRNATEHRIEQLQAYREKRDRWSERVGMQAKSLYRLARGGLVRSILAPPQVHAASADAWSRGRALRFVVAHYQAELGAWVRAERRVAQELDALRGELESAEATAKEAHRERDALGHARTEIASQIHNLQRDRKRDPKRSNAAFGRMLDVLERERVKLEHERADLVRPGSAGRRWTKPVQGQLLARFGTGEDPVLRIPIERNGIELAARPYAIVRATAAGTVVSVARVPAFDHVVVIDHGDDELSLTGRLVNPLVEPGQIIERGQAIGQAAAKRTDDGLGHSVYFEVRRAGAPIDPATLGL